MNYSGNRRDDVGIVPYTRSIRTHKTEVLVILRERSDRRISLTITASIGEILHFVQNDSGVF